jgi:nucleoside-diphosphate-sugar epimerase
MRVLVTGDRGYVGAIIAPILRATGHEVVNLAVSIRNDGTPTLMTDRRNLRATA